MKEKDFNDILEIEGIYAKGFGMISKLLMQDVRITPYAKCIYSYFCSYAGNGSQAFPSVSLILHHLGMSETTYYKHFKLLKDYGYIKTKQSKSNGKYSKTIYTLVSNPTPSIKLQCTVNESTELQCTENKGYNINSSLKLTSSYNNQSINHKTDGLIDNEIVSLPIATITSELNEYNNIKELISKNIDLDNLKEENPHDNSIENIYEIIVDVISSKKNYIRINGENKSTDIVKGIFIKLNGDHVRYVIETLKKNTTKANNIKSYITTSLYNSYSTLDVFYTNTVNHDLYGVK